MFGPEISYPEICKGAESRGACEKIQYKTAEGKRAPVCSWKPFGVARNRKPICAIRPTAARALGAPNWYERAKRRTTRKGPALEERARMFMDVLGGAPLRHDPCLTYNRDMCENAEGEAEHYGVCRWDADKSVCTLRRGTRKFLPGLAPTRRRRATESKRRAPRPREEEEKEEEEEEEGEEEEEEKRGELVRGQAEAKYAREETPPPPPPRDEWDEDEVPPPPPLEEEELGGEEQSETESEYEPPEEEEDSEAEESEGEGEYAPEVEEDEDD